jgi:hypothetical protein
MREQRIPEGYCGFCDTIVEGKECGRPGHVRSGPGPFTFCSCDEHAGGVPIHFGLVVLVGLSFILLVAGLLWWWLGSPALGQTDQTILYLVADPDSVLHDSYVLPLTDPADIAHADSLISEGPQELASIAVARIAEGADGINRNHLAPGKPEWSWHVTSFVEFAENTIEICDGTPTQVENDVPGWIQNTGGQICFWSYTVVQNLGPVPVEPVTWSRLKRLFGSGPR